MATESGNNRKGTPRDASAGSQIVNRLKEIVLARALTGDVAGAIDDFEAYVAWTGNDRDRAQRQGWIDALRAGQNPFTSELLERLRN